MEFYPRLLATSLATLLLVVATPRAVDDIPPIRQRHGVAHAGQGITRPSLNPHQSSGAPDRALQPPARGARNHLRARLHRARINTEALDVLS